MIINKIAKYEIVSKEERLYKKKTSQVSEKLVF